jgi:hypothetical protein
MTLLAGWPAASYGVLALLALQPWTTKLRFGEMIARSYLDALGPFQDRLLFSGLMWRFLWDFHLTVLQWARWARSEVQAWPGDLPRPMPAPSSPGS